MKSDLTQRRKRIFTCTADAEPFLLDAPTRRGQCGAIDLIPDQRPPLPLPSPAPLAPPDEFVALLRDVGVVLDEQKIVQLGDYLARLLAMNEQMNLTAIESPLLAWQRHAFDALTLLPLLSDIPSGATLIDIGSGGGLPGIPLAIARPDLRITLVEATQKKAAFLVAVARALHLENVTVLAERAEILAKGDLRGRFDIVTARAVAKLSQLVPWTAPFAKPGGRLLLMKGQRAEEELKEAAKVLPKHRAAFSKTVPTPTGRIVVFKKQ